MKEGASRRPYARILAGRVLVALAFTLLMQREQKFQSTKGEIVLLFVIAFLFTFPAGITLKLAVRRALRATGLNPESDQDRT